MSLCVMEALMLLDPELELAILAELALELAL